MTTTTTENTTTEAGLWRAVADLVGGPQSAGPVPEPVTTSLQAALRAVLAHYGSDGTDPCVCFHPASAHSVGGCRVSLPTGLTGTTTVAGFCKCQHYESMADVQPTADDSADWARQRGLGIVEVPTLGRPELPPREPECQICEHDAGWHNRRYDEIERTEGRAEADRFALLHEEVDPDDE